jgi:pimeloyl-ACP methyl ester carboxylesterase
MRVDSSGVGIEYDLAGPADGPPVVLIHGFPDSGRVWRNQVPALAEAGLRVIVPDMRGCGRSERPGDVGAYQLPFLVGDVVAVLDDIDVERAAIVGHDWGAAIAWALASLSSSRVQRLAALSLGHPTAFRGAGLAQQEKSWYLLLFYLPGVAERWLSDNNWANLRQWSGHPDADAVIADLTPHHGLTAALNWYRANLPPEAWVDPPPTLPPVRCPTLGVWSTGDFALLEAQMTASAQYCAGGFQYRRVEDAGHWLQLDAPESINRLLVDFLTKFEE